MRIRIYEKLSHLPISYIDSHEHGDIVSRTLTDVDQFSDGLLMGFSQLFTGLITIVGTIGFMLKVNVIIALDFIRGDLPDTLLKAQELVENLEESAFHRA